MVIKGKVNSIYSQSKTWVCFSLLENETGKEYRTVGNYSGQPLSKDLPVSVEGTLTLDGKYGYQIKLSSLTVDRDNSIQDTLVFLLKGVGRKLADDIYGAFGEETLSVVVNTPERLLEIKGITEKKYREMVPSDIKDINVELCREIFKFFKGDVTPRQVRHICEACKDSLSFFVKNVEANPYWLIYHIDGFAFKKTDALALASGIEPFSTERIEAAVVFALRQASQVNGHCFLYMSELTKEVSDVLLSVPEGVSGQTVTALRKSIDEENEKRTENTLKKHPELEGWCDSYKHIIDVMADALVYDCKEGLIEVEDEAVYLKDLYDTEVSIAEKVSCLARKAPVKSISSEETDSAVRRTEAKERYILTEEQKKAVSNSLKHRISIITGGPGRGKTTILKAVIEAWNDPENTVLLAPTGRAAKRMTEATGYPASTIHRYRNRVSSSFKAKEAYEEYCRKKKLFIVDEVSMIGLPLAKTLLSLTEPGNIILVGDVDQLSSIEPGTFMKSLIDSKAVFTSFLTTSFRNEGSIAKDADMINKGNAVSSLIFDDEVHFLETEASGTVSAVKSIYRTLVKKYREDEIEVLSPMRSKGFGCADNLNRAIKEMYGPVKESDPAFRAKDRVMYIHNNYQKTLTNKEGETETGVFNGDTGTVVKVTPETVTVLFDDERTGVFSEEEAEEDLVLSFAATVHKAQGSEYDAVVLVMSSQHAFMLKRNLFYTGFTRAKKEVYIVGDKKALSLAVWKTDSSVRNTRLKERIVKECRKKS